MGENKTSASQQVADDYATNQLLDATYRTFHEIPADERYLDIMKAFIECRVNEGRYKLAEDLMLKTNGATLEIVREYHQARMDLDIAYKQYNRLTSPFWKK
jgi:hypothetical protein